MAVPRQEDGDGRTEKEKQAAIDEGAGGAHRHQVMEAKTEGNGLRDHEEESSDWPRERVCHTHERAVPIQQTVEALDITEEGTFIW